MLKNKKSLCAMA